MATPGAHARAIAAGFRALHSWRMLTLAPPMQLPSRLREGLLSAAPLLVTQTIAVPLLLRWTERRRLRERGRPRALPALAIGATALGAFALGALSIGAFSIGTLVLGTLGVGSARLKRLRIESLTVDEMNLPPSPLVS